MTSRERVAEAVNFGTPDRVPIDLGGMRASGINAVVYHELKQRLGIHTPTKIWDKLQILAQVELDVLDRLHGDVVPLEPGLSRWAGQRADDGVPVTLFCGQRVTFPPGTAIRTEPDGSWMHCDSAGTAFAHMPKDGYYFDYVRSTMSGDQINPDAFRPPTTVPDEELEALRARADYLFRETDKAILGWGFSLSLLGMSALLSDNITQGSLDNWLCMLMTEKAAANDMMARYVDAVIACLKLYHEAVGNRCVAWGIASDDAGTQRSELVSPELFEEMIKPHYTRLCDWVHTNTPWKTYLHSCGSIFRYIEHWIDAGIDILNPVQISAANMDPDELMEAYGGKVVFWGGGCDTQSVLPKGSREEIRKHIKRNIAAFGQKGGYVFTQVHNIQQTVPVDNLLTMFEAAHEFGSLTPD
ncbi:MAG: hypothetical protein HN742_03270 [Lentisphaerae bacterium]|nr:hypothetical protein [Lentisphaerota bacterium]MBT4821849.1 hypothetical protein [Lentisphaerota bacterium]MBT5605490.1 hypothetical protein [Lentisphaerota bacterium]MBT7060079.1 hypothetical protein [Lentisphaerota bacterium]MBT7840861.1 hypothetical protein [Lentisphaerota bacterium]